MARVGQERRRRPGFQQSVEVAESALGLAELQRHPAQLVRGVEPQLPARVVLLHLLHEPLDLGRLAQAQQGLAEPVARLADLSALGRFLHRALEHRARLLHLAALVARAAALDQLGGHAEEVAHRIAGQEARRGQRRHRPVSEVAHHGSGRQGEGARRRGRQRHRGQRHRRLVERRRGQGDQRGDVGRRQDQRDVGPGAAPRRQREQRGECEDGAQASTEMGHAHGLLWPDRGAIFLGALFVLGLLLVGPFGAGLVAPAPDLRLALTAASRSLAQEASVLSGLLLATSS